MKKWIAKKMTLLLSVSLLMGMNSAPLSLYGSEGAADIGADPATGFSGGGYERTIDPAANIEYEATLEVDGVTTPYKELVDAWKAGSGKKATICLLKSVNLGEKETGGMNGHDTDNAHTFFIWSGDDITLKMNDGVQLYNDKDGGALIQVSGGTFTLESGEISRINQSGGQENTLLVTEGNLFIKGGTVNNNNAAALTIYADSADANVSISGGVFKGRYEAVKCSGMMIREILANGRAFYDKNKNGSGDWLRSEVMDAQTTNPTGGDVNQEVEVREYPIRYKSDLTSQTIGYGTALPNLHVEAEIVDTSAFNSGATIAYQWFQKTQHGDVEITGETGQDYTPDETKAGTYEYYCKATCEWFSLDSTHAVMTIDQKLLEVKVLGEIKKPYDGTNEAGPVSIPPLQFAEGGIVGNDDVTASAIKAVFPDAEAGVYSDVVLELALQGTDAYNYKILEPVTAPGRIDPLPTAGISINVSSLALQRGGSSQLVVTIFPEDGTDKTVYWTSSNPAVASVDQNGKVTAVGAGSAVITVTTADGNFTASCSVTVSGHSGSPSPGSGMSSTPTENNIWQPFIKGNLAKQGWNEIHMEAERIAAFGTGTVTIDMNHTAVVPGSFFNAIRGSEVTAVFEMDGGITWNVCGKDISAETVLDTDFSVKLHAGAVPKHLIDEAAGSFDYLELKLTQNKTFGFQAVLMTRIVKDKDSFTFGSGTGNEYAGMYANLFYYNTALNKLEFICADKIEKNGLVNLPFRSVSDYVVVLSPSAMNNADAPDNDNLQKPEQKIPIQESAVKLSKTVYTYNGKTKKPSVTALDEKGKQIPENYYTVSYQNNKKVGEAAAVIVFKDGYTGTVKKTFTIRPCATSVEKIKAASNGFTVKWAKKTAQTSGYQMQYSENAAFKGNSTRSVFVTKSSITKKSVKNLKPAKKYFMRIRTYKTIKTGGKSKKIYSAWSMTIRVKTRAAVSKNAKN